MKHAIWVGLAFLALIVAACGEAAETTTTPVPPADTTTTAPEPEPEPEPEPVGELLVWADERRAPVVEAVAPTFTEATGVTVSVEIVDFGDIKDQVALAGPAGEGPDLFIGAHDWTGELAASGVIDPIDLGAKAGDFFEVALGAFSFDGELYSVPYATEAIAMYYNTDLVEEAPAAFEEIADVCAGLEGITNCIGLPGGGDGPDAYHHYPFVSALGGYIFAYDPEAGFDPSDVGLDNEGAVAGITFLEGLVDDGLVAATNYDDAKNLFLEGQQAFRRRPGVEVLVEHPVGRHDHGADLPVEALRLLALVPHQREALAGKDDDVGARPVAVRLLVGADRELRDVARHPA